MPRLPGIPGEVGQEEPRLRDAHGLLELRAGRTLLVGLPVHVLEVDVGDAPADEKHDGRPRLRLHLEGSGVLGLLQTVQELEELAAIAHPVRPALALREASHEVGQVERQLEHRNRASGVGGEGAHALEGVLSAQRRRPLAIDRVHFGAEVVEDQARGPLVRDLDETREARSPRGAEEILQARPLGEEVEAVQELATRKLHGLRTSSLRGRGGPLPQASA